MPCTYWVLYELSLPGIAHLEISDPYNINFERKQDRHQQNQCSDEIPRGSGGDVNTSYQKHSDHGDHI